MKLAPQSISVQRQLACRFLARAILSVTVAFTLVACNRQPPDSQSPSEIAKNFDSVEGGTTESTSTISPASPVAVAANSEQPLSEADAARCIAERGKPRAARDVAVHRWVDAAGIIHFSDHAPDGDALDYRVINVGDAPSVDVDVSGYDTNLPPETDARAVADALAIDALLQRLIGPRANPSDPEPKLALRIIFVQKAETYAQLVSDRKLADSQGAYSSRDSTIYVRIQASDAATFAVMRHEIAHAVLHERVGILAIPINEGLAVYAEHLDAASPANGTMVDLQSMRPALAAALPNDPLVALNELLARDENTFYDNPSVPDATGEGRMPESRPAENRREIRYLRAFSLVATLLSNSQGTAALSRLLNEQRNDPCRTASAAELFDEGYLGGLAQLARNWVDWIRAACAIPPKN